MKTTKLFSILIVALVCAAAPAVTIDMVAVGNPGNAPDTRYDATGFGSVGYNYRIGKYEITAGQYTEFLNAVAKADTYGLYSTAMGDPAGSSRGANIKRSGSSGNYSYSVAADWANRPVNYVSFWDAARFANWLHNGQPTGEQGPGTTEGGAYINIGNQATFARQPGARFFLPTEDEWYKAAYHDQRAGLAASYFDYPTGTNSVPGNDVTESASAGDNANYYGSDFAIGSPYYRTEVGAFRNSAGPYGTFDQGGNVWEWNETALFDDYRNLRGGSFSNGSLYLLASYRLPGPFESYHAGFRVASVIPEPGSIPLCLAAVMVLAMQRASRNGTLISANLR